MIKYEGLQDKDLRHIFDANKKHGMLQVDGVRRFLDEAEEREEFKTVLESIPKLDTIAKRTVYDHFATRKGLTGAQFAALVDLLPDALWPPPDINRQAMKAITSEYRNMDRMSFETFSLYFDRVISA